MPRVLRAFFAFFAGAALGHGGEPISHHTQKMPPTPLKELGLSPKPVVIPEPRPLAVAPPSAPPPVARPSATEPDGAWQLFGNPQRNSRLPAALPRTSAWGRTVTTPLGEDFVPDGLIANDQVVVLSTRPGLLMFDPQGRLVGDHLPAGREVVIAPSRSHLVHVDRHGFVAGHPLGAGAGRFQLSPSFGNTYQRDQIVFLGDHLLVLGQKRIPLLERPDGQAPKPEAVIDSWAWPKTVQTDDDGYATNAAKLRSLSTVTPRMVAAAVGQSLIVALSDCLYRLTPDLQITRVLTGKFEPIAMSADETGATYLVTRNAATFRLLVIDAEGRQSVSAELPPGPGNSYDPPIVGFDHTIYVATADRILVFDSQGRPQPPIPIRQRFAGAAVTADHQLLVADGEGLTAHAGGVPPVVLAEFAGESLRTAPVLLRSGVLWIATDKNLHALSPTRR